MENLIVEQGQYAKEERQKIVVRVQGEEEDSKDSGCDQTRDVTSCVLRPGDRKLPDNLSRLAPVQRINRQQVDKPPPQVDPDQVPVDDPDR